MTPDDEDNEENLPQSSSTALIPNAPTFDTTLNEDSTLDEVRKADINIFNFQLSTLSTAYTHVRSIGGLIALNREVRDMIKARRDILGLEYGAPTNKASRTLVYEPLA